MAQSPRHHAREVALQALYALESNGQKVEAVAEAVIGGDDELTEAARQFAQVLFSKTLENRTRSDEAISRLAKNWELSRIAMIDRIILRMAMTEMWEIVDVPVKVVLNEAIELAKLYSTAQSAAFVNGILDSFVKEQPDLLETR